MIPVLALLAEPDLEKLNEAARGGLHEMPGCHELQGELVRVAWVGVLKDTESYDLKARLVDGEWQQLDFELQEDQASNVELALDMGEARYPFVPPMLGALPAESRSEHSLGESLMAEVVEALSGEVETAWVSVGELEGQQVYVLERSIAIEDTRNRELDLRVWVEEGQDRARRWEATLPRGVRLATGTWLRKVGVVLEVDEQGLPQAERLVGTMRAGPIAVRLRQKLSWEVVGSCE